MCSSVGRGVPALAKAARAGGHGWASGRLEVGPTECGLSWVGEREAVAWVTPGFSFGCPGRWRVIEDAEGGPA